MADFPTDFKANYWSSAIGAADSPPNDADQADGIVINSGVIYAGTTSADDCTAIGGGGNNYGGVTINGGIVTAVTASTGTAIGGGIGWGSQGGDANVLISGGTVYAYNHGIGPDSGSYTSFVPAVAIGGGSADKNTGNKSTTVTITGGNVYAQSVGGAAIGGGGSGTMTGGDATVNIESGTVIAKSVGGKVKYNKDNNKNHEETISPGVSIGGGTGKTGGGSVILNVSGENTILRTGSIGGGKATGSGSIGSANVTITGGDITGQVIMAGGANKACTFDMSGGKIHGTNVVDGNKVTDAGFDDPQPAVPILYIQKDGGAVWMEDKNGVTNIIGGTIEGCTAKRGGAIFMEGGTFTLSGSGTISGNTAEQDVNDEDNSGRGGAVFIKNGNAHVNGGSISGNKAERRGGGLCVNGGDVHITGGLISKNTAEVRGGGVYLTGGQFTMDDGTISGNTANYRGGGIFLTQEPTLDKGVISGNHAEDFGGGLCINGDKLVLNSPNMQIYGNTAKNGGGVAVLNGEFILNGGAVGVDDPSKAPNKATKNGGGVFVQEESTTAGSGTNQHASVTVKSGNIWYNEAENGGGVYLDKGKGDFTLDGKDASISHNKAANGAGIYLYKDPLLNQGTITSNIARENGGGMYISDCVVTLNPTGNVTIQGNTALKNGAGIYIHGSTPGTSGGLSSPDNPDNEVDAVSSASILFPDEAVGLLVDSEAAGTVKFTNNTATESGGAVCVTAGYFYQKSNLLTVTGNEAANGGGVAVLNGNFIMTDGSIAGNKAENGGGVAVLNGNFTMTNGSIGEKEGTNTATNGGGVYVSTGEVWLKGGSVQYNEATDGGGAYVTGGRIVMIDGSLANNAATQKGGGAYVAGNFRMLGGTVGGISEDGISHGNTAVSGGGVYVSEGNVYVIYGEITHNAASDDGGGFHVSAASKNVEVAMLSGSLSYNTAAKNGGGMAVKSDNTTSSKIKVEIGCLMHHPVENGRPMPFSYEGDPKYDVYARFDNKDYKHESCPVVEHNNAGIKGGGFYLDSNTSTVSFYCIEETENTATDVNGAGMDVEGGGVIIGDEEYHNYLHDQSDDGKKLEKPRGYIRTGNATMVNGGQVDIYGDMDNPSFIDEVMVDILDSTHDHFRDHRRSEKKEVYKVHYFENFVGGTGLYTAKEYKEPNLKFPVEGALYNRPGYEIRGWCTTAAYDKTDSESKYYSVGDMIDLTDKDLPGMGIYEETSCEICKNYKDETLLKLYAIWKVNGYVVHFEPNVPEGETYSGNMEDQGFTYDQEQPLAENMFKYTGHVFEGWTINADGTGTLYKDKQSVKNLTTVAGETVTLYAKWKVCDHKDSHRWKYDVINGNKTLRRICDCGGQTLHATLSAENTVYDGCTHEATLTLDDKAAWGEDAPTVTYTGNWINGVHAGVDGNSPLGSDSIPRHAGVYTASITKPDEKSGDCPQNPPVTAFIEYIIAKANQPAPDKPKYTPPSVGGNTVTIAKLDKDPTTLTDKEGKSQEARAQYRLAHSGGSDIAWEYMEDKNELTKSMDTAYTTYFVEVRYEELNDYNASEITRANSTYFFEGNVQVEVECDEGINYGEMTFLEDINGLANGIEFLLTLEKEYYLINGKYTVTAQRWEITSEGDKEGEEENMPVADPVDDKLSIPDIPNNSYLFIHIGETRKNPIVNAKIAPKQVFSSVTNIETIISRDSAYTAAFCVDNYVPDFYNAPKLTFDTNIPENTTIILLDRQSNGTKNYWYYRAESATNEVPLTAFKKMGESGSFQYSVPVLGEGEKYANLDYQFIVDFSRSADKCSGDNLNMILEATHNNKPETVSAPEIKSSVTVSMKNKTFEFTPAETNGNDLTNSFTCTFNVDGSAAASKWDDRASALILKPEQGTALPVDARIKAVVDGETTYLYKNKESFLIPLSLLNAEKQVSLTLESVLFPESAAQYKFTAEWLVSPSKADRAPMTGDTAGGLQNVIFKSAAKQTLSLKSEGAQRILTTQNALNLDIKKQHLDGYFIEAKLLRKSESTGEYIETGWNKSPVEDKLEVGLAGQTPGSFCLMLYVKQREDSAAIEMRVPYYFIIKQTE